MMGSRSQIDPHLASPCQGEGPFRVCGSILLNQWRGSSPSQREARWGYAKRVGATS